MNKRKKKDSQLFKDVSLTTSKKISELVEKVKGVKKKKQENADDSRAESLGKELTEGDFQACEEDEKQAQLDKLNKEFSEDN